MDYLCKSNDVELRIVKRNYVIDEILVRDVSGEGWTVVGFSDLMDAIKEATQLSASVDSVEFKSRVRECTDLEGRVYTVLMNSMLECDYNSGKLSLRKIQESLDAPVSIGEVKSSLQHLMSLRWVSVYKPRLNRKLYYINLEGLIKKN